MSLYNQKKKTENARQQVMGQKADQLQMAAESINMYRKQATFFKYGSYGNAPENYVSVLNLCM